MALVIFFVPDPTKGVAEMARVVRPGGTIAAYVWDIYWVVDIRWNRCMPKCMPWGLLPLARPVPTCPERRRCGACG